MPRIKKIRVAIVAPPFGTTGGPEIVVQNLTNTLLERKDVSVTLFAPADWHTKARHIATLKKSLWNMRDFAKQTLRERKNYIVASQLPVLLYQNDFDVIHLHLQNFSAALGTNMKTPCVLSLHNPINKRDLSQIKKVGIHVVAITKAQKGSLEIPTIIWNGVPIRKIFPSYKKGSYLIAIGRLTDQKGIHRAIAIAKKAQKKLIVVGRIGNEENRQIYYKKMIKPFIDGKGIVHIEHLSRKDLFASLKKASALLFPIIRIEPFGLVVAEALACGTPVIGSRVSPLPEILKNKKTAFLSNDLKELVSAVKNINRFDRRECRRYAEENFDSAVMAEKYVKVYKSVLNKSSHF